VEQPTTPSKGAKVRAVSGNWNEVFGYYPSEEQVGWIKETALYLDALVADGAGCYHIGTVFDDLAEALDTDRGRAEYVFGGAAMFWSQPSTAEILLDCFP
jgi:hypothetical protein